MSEKEDYTMAQKDLSQNGRGFLLIGLFELRLPGVFLKR